MESVYFYFVLTILGVNSMKSYTVEDLKCVICKSVVAEIESIVNRASPKVLANVGSYRLDEKGNMMARTIPLVQSEAFLTEAMESACDRMEEYARGYDRKTRKLRIVKMRLGEALNPEMTEIHAISDVDLNESLKYHCEGITDEHENGFLKVFRKAGANNLNRICVRETHLCKAEEAENVEL